MIRWQSSRVQAHFGDPVSIKLSTMRKLERSRLETRAFGEVLSGSTSAIRVNDLTARRRAEMED